MKTSYRIIKIHIITIVFILNVLISMSGCSSMNREMGPDPESGRSPELSAPSFSTLDFHKTDFLPQNYLEAPGVIMGTWFSASESHKLKVGFDTRITADPECRKNPYDCLSVSFPGSNVEPFGFKAAFGNFLVYGVDVDGDYIKEIVIESVESRDSESRMLRVLKFINNELTEVFRAQLNGTFAYASVRADSNETVKWQRNYAFKSRGRMLDIVLYLDKPVNNVVRISELNDLMVLQLKKITASYDSKSSSFVVKNTDLRPVDSR